MNNFETYFIKNKEKGFKHNVGLWLNECEDSKLFEGTPTDAKIYLFYHPDSNICQHPKCNKVTKFVSIGAGFNKTCCRDHSAELRRLHKWGVLERNLVPQNDTI
jgi:hypothetical protein